MAKRRFQSTLPAWGETPDLDQLFQRQAAVEFQSTLPAWGETWSRLTPDWRRNDFNPLSPHGERPFPGLSLLRPVDFNPLSPHGERPAGSRAEAEKGLISIHSPRMGRDQTCPFRVDSNGQFQSTLPAWGETGAELEVTHAFVFQSTLPAWGETNERSASTGKKAISIHSPRMGRDRGGGGIDGKGSHFNPLSPHGERPTNTAYKTSGPSFQSTLPAWGETHRGHPPSHGGGISIHSPRMGRDQARDRRQAGDAISIHSPRMGRDKFQNTRSAPAQFQSTLPAWGETLPGYQLSSGEILFQSTLPAWGET